MVAAVKGGSSERRTLYFTEMRDVESWHLMRQRRRGKMRGVLCAERTLWCVETIMS